MIDNREKSATGGDGEADFGFRRVPSAERAGLVGAVFESVASRYDLMNDLMSGGLHRLWKAALIDWLKPRPGMRLIDIAGGTGDVAERILARAGEVVVCDINPTMRETGRDRALDKGFVGGIRWVCGDAEALPFATNSTDGSTIAFGLRNVTHRDAALAEARRVLAPGGHFLCLEFSRVVLPLLAPIYDIYSLKLVPALGGMVTGDPEAYRYLVESIRRFPDQETLAEEMRRAGFDNVTYRNLSGGIVAIHSGWRV